MISRRGFLGTLGAIVGTIVTAPLVKAADFFVGGIYDTARPQPVIGPTYFDLNDDSVIDMWERELMHQVMKQCPLVSVSRKV